MTKNNVVLHIGLQKTGTTFLQKEVFSKIKGINYIRTLRLYTTFKENKINLVSDESLSGGSYYPEASAKDGYTAVNRLKCLFPRAKIIIGIRGKEAWLNSLHAQYAWCGHLTFSEWFAQSDQEKFDIEKYVCYIKSLFDDVFVYEQEKLLNESDKVIGDMCKFIGVSAPVYKNKRHNIKFTKRQVERIRKVNKIFRGNRESPSLLFYCFRGILCHMKIRR